MSELTELTELCRRLGAKPEQADAMARQLSRRADQLAVERGLSREAAMAYLLNLVTQGNQGKVPEEFLPPIAGGGDKSK